MGNPQFGSALAVSNAATIHTFYSPNSWIEGAAVQQLHHVAAMDGVKKIASFPDLHPGKYGPVGCAVLAERVYPQLIGNDIGCGMSLFALDIAPRKLRLEKVAEKLRSLEGQYDGKANELLEEAGLSGALFPESLGTIGGGNHFCEVQSIAQIFHPHSMLDKEHTYLLIHSGSRALGAQIFAAVQASLSTGLAAKSDDLHDYLSRHDEAVRWATLNRHTIARRAAEALRSDFESVIDVPHNLVEVFNEDYLHRKGAAKADVPLVPLAGSRDTLSYLLQPTGKEPNALSSLAHGSGRKYDRSSMYGRAGTTKLQREQLERNSFGGRVVCEDKQLLIEEAATAYKKPEQAVEDLTQFGLADPVASFRPLVTFKKSVSKDDGITSIRRTAKRGQ